MSPSNIPSNPPLHGLADTPANNPLNKPPAPLHTTAKPNINKPAKGDGKNNKKYATIWRWHFYAGMFIAPFLLILSLSALGMLFMANTVGPNNELLTVSKQDTITPVSVQAHSALSAVPDGTLKQYIAPKSDHNVALFRVGSETGQTMVAVDPYSAKVIKIAPSDSNLYHTFDNIHSDLLIGKVGDYLLETAASLTTLLVLTGWYLWWYRRKSITAMLIPDAKLNNKRSTFVTIHATLGTWLSVLLLLFCVSGMAWAGIWGGKVVQAWSQFPAGKWGNGPMPASTLPPTHGEALNSSGIKEVPWILELTPMPTSGSTLGEKGIDPSLPITLDTVDRFARDSGFEGRYQLNLPQGETGVWTLSQDSMSYDTPSPMADRTMHIDRYSGKVLADIRFEDYNAFGKFMAAGNAIHMGTLGLWSLMANVLFCLSVITICISGYVMWWQRRPSKLNTAVTQKSGLNPPPSKGDIPWGLAIILLIVSVIFPTAIIAIVAIAVLDFVIIGRVPVLKRLLK